MKDDSIDADGGWTLEIRPRNSLFAVDFEEIWRYALLDLIDFCLNESTKA